MLVNEISLYYDARSKKHKKKSGVCHTMSVTVSCAGHRHRVTYTTCRIDTIDSPDDEHEVARNM